MSTSNIYTKLVFLLSFFVLGTTSVSAQLELKLQLMNDSTWGVYVKPVGVTPSTSTITGSGQVTLVAPTGFAYSTLTSVKGTWVENARVNAPVENTARDYISFGFVTDNPQIIYAAGTETLLFTIKKIQPCPDTLYLIKNGVDPFDQLPNSANSNPGNDLSVVDFGVSPTGFYYYSANYAFSAWSCEDCDGDGILNGLEDTNGNGSFDSGVDASNLCDPCDPIHVETADLSFIGESNFICSGDALDTSYLVVTIVGGWTPYTLVYSNGSVLDTVTNYTSGDSIAVVPSTTTTYTLVTVIDSFLCEINPDSLAGSIPITVEGPLSITDQPDDVTECSTFGTSFSVVAANGGAGTVSYNWQVSANGGSTWGDIASGTPYSNAQTATLTLSSTAGLHNRRYRVKIWTPHCDTVYSNSALLQVEGPITVTTNPSNKKICDGATTTFTGAANNAGAVGTLAYNWQVNTGSAWVDLTNTSPYSGATTTTLTITGATVALDSNLYRMKVSTGQCDTIYTNSAILDIEGPLTFTAHPIDRSNCAGNEVFFNYTYTNPGGGPVTFQWQQSLDNGSTWTNLSNGTVYNNTNGTSLGEIGDTLAVTNVLGLDGAMFRVFLKTSTCGNVFSNAATLDVNGVVTFSNHPDDITVCSGSDTMFVAAATISQGTFTYNWQVSTDGGATYSDISPPVGVYTTSTAGDTLFVSNVASLYNYRYRVQIVSAACEPVNSNEARLQVEGPLSVSVQPVSVTACSADNDVTFSATIDNPGVTGSTVYRWQLSTNGGSTWANLSNNAIYNGTGTSVLSISNTAGLGGYQFRLGAGTSRCSQVFTNAATLTVEGPVTITTQPSAVTVCSSGPTSFTAVVANAGSGTMSYQWQVSTDNGLNWSNLANGGVYSNVTTTTLNISDVTGLYDRCYRMRVLTTECSAVYTDKACLTVEGPIAISNQPDTVTQCSGEPVQFIVGVTDGAPSGSGVTYQWQESTNNGTTWTNLVNGPPYNGVKSDTLSISSTTGKDNNLYRVLVASSTCSTITSDTAMLLIEGPITIVDEPDNATECSGSGATFQATIANAGLGTVLYQWERSCDGGTTWADVSNGGANGYSGATTTTLVITDVAGLGDCRFRLRYYTANCTDAYTNYAVLTVEGPIDFTDQPDSIIVCSGSSACFTVVTSNTGSGAITYQWQIKPTSASPWVNMNNNSIYNGTKTANMCLANVAGLNGAYFRVLIQTTTCASVVSDSALLTVEGPVSFTDHPDDITQCSGESVLFIGSAGIAVGNSGTITYQWQVSSDNGLNWSNLSEGAPYVGVTNDSLTISNVAGLDSRRYRLSATTATCSNVYSNSARLTVEGPLNITTQPVDWTSCSDKEALFFAKMTNPGQSAIQYQWQQSTNGGTTWVNLANGMTVDSNFFNGVKTDSLLITPIDGLGNTMYRLKGWTATCDTLTTTAATLGVEGPLVFTDEADDVTLCSGGPTSFTVTVSNTGLGTIQYQWQRSSNGGQTWVNLTNTTPYSGVTTNTLAISSSAGLGNYKFRCRVKTPNCDWTASVAANLFVEGPITVSLQPVNASVCSNIGHIFTTTVTNPGSGALQFQWQVSANSGSTWSNLSNGTVGFGTGTYQGSKTEDLNISLVDGLNGYMYRLLIRTSTCFDTTNQVTLSVLDACSAGGCDFDLDGITNTLDDDDDNDQFLDFYEDWMTTHNVSDGWNYIDDLSNPINYSRCNVDTDGDGIWDSLEDPDGDNLSNQEETDGDGIFDGNPLDPCDPILGPTCIGINLAIKVYLQGPKIGVADTLMRDDLRSKGYIPLSEPYEAMTAFSHTGDGGGEVIADSAGILGVTGANAIVDWIFIELRPSSNLDSIYSTRAALLQRDGDVVDVDGISSLNYPNANGGSYYVSVRHRNHLGIMTAEALDLSPLLQEIDFTDTSFLTNGQYAQVNLNGRMAMWAGDLNSDGRSIYQGPGNDVLNLFTTVLYDSGNTGFIANYITAGYLVADIDMNGRAIYQGPANDRAMVLFNVILNYPANGSNLANYAILEQLP